MDSATHSNAPKNSSATTLNSHMSRKKRFIYISKSKNRNQRLSIIGKEKYIKNIIHTCNVFNILSIHYYRLIRKQAFNNPLITNPHIADVPAIDEKNTKNTLVVLIPYKKRYFITYKKCQKKFIIQLKLEIDKRITRLSFP